MAKVVPHSGRPADDDRTVRRAASGDTVGVEAAPDVVACPQCGGLTPAAAPRCISCARRTRASAEDVRLDASSYRATERGTFRLYCVMCGRGSEVSTVARQPGRCAICGGTQLTEDQQ